MYHKPSHILIALSVVVTIATGLGFIIGQSRSVIPSPSSTDSLEKICSKELKVCPDGINTVGRMPPSCEYEQCPKVIPDISTSLKSYYPDYPIDASSPLSVQYVIEHRSALNGQNVVIEGIVTQNNLKDYGCLMQLCTTFMGPLSLTEKSNIVINDIFNPQTETWSYSLPVFTDGIDPQIQKQFSGKNVEIKGTVKGDSSSVAINASTISAKSRLVFPAKQNSNGFDYAEGQISVLFRSTSEQALNLLYKYNLSTEKSSANSWKSECIQVLMEENCPPVKSPNEPGYFTLYVTVPPGTETEWIERLNQEPHVAHAEYIYYGVQQ